MLDLTSLFALTRRNTIDIDEQKISKAFDFALKAYVDQKRKSGEPYIVHALEVAIILAQWKLDEDSIIAGLLHNIIEDTTITSNQIEHEFGKDIKDLVVGVTKVEDLEHKKKDSTQTMENFRKLVLVMAKDLRVVLIKLADILHNMRTLQYLSEVKQRETAQEILEIFAPLAERLGMGEVKGELEDLAFMYCYKDEYKALRTASRLEYKKAEEHIKKMHNVLLSDLAARGVEAEINGRKKHLYSLWKKLQRSDIKGNFDKVNDIVALRILVDTTEECYVALGVVHAHYKPVPSITLSDFIAQPKPNGYQSIHTKVFGPSNRPVEIQIRTFAMHNQAEYGAAAHWNISELKSSGKLSSEQIDKGKSHVDKDRLKWVQQLVAWQKEFEDEKQFEEAVKFDALSHRQFVFSPMGDVYDLPVGATPVDFAAAVHTDLINYIKHAKVNDEIVSLSSPLKSGDIVHIEKTKVYKKPNKDWIRTVKTTEAKKALVKSLGEKR